VGVYSANLRWSMVPFREMAGADLRLPVAFGHDVRAAGTAEFRLGAAAPFRDVIVMTIGTGIAAAVFVDGRLHTGDGFAGETGHARVAAGPRCGCGGRGCLEAVASASAIARRYTEATGKPVTGAKAVLERATAGEVAAVNVWETALDGLALSLSHASMLLAPEAIVLGGGLAQAGRALTGPLQRRLEELLASRRRPQLLLAAVGEDAGVIGAALMARDLDVAGVSSVNSRAGAPVTTGDRSS
jgi:glucokinase